MTKPTYEELEARVNELAAENAALKAFRDKLNDMHNDLNGEGTGIQGRAEVACQQVALEAAIEEFDNIKTPATDAAIAAMRAEGVEMAIETVLNVDTVASTGVVKFLLQQFAAQLRSKSAPAPFDDDKKWKDLDSEPTKPGGWKEWNGGECPVPDDSPVEVKFRIGTIITDRLAGEYDWCHGYADYVTSDADIIAYRLHQSGEEVQ